MKRRDGTKFQPTTPEQLAYIREHWSTMTSIEISAPTGVRPQTVKAIASRLKLFKHPAVIERARKAANAARSVHRGNFRRPTPFGTHRDLLLGITQPVLEANTGRVHRIRDDDREAA